MVTIRYRYVHEDVDRHGNVRLYFHRRGRAKVRLRALPGTPEFAAEYAAALAASDAPAAEARPTPSTARARPGTWRWLCEAYFASGEFRHMLDPSTQRTRRLLLEATFDEAVAPGRAELYCDFPVDRMTGKAIAVLRDRKAGFPAAANGRVKCVRRVFAWACAQEPPLVAANPARDVALLKRASAGYHTWTLEQVEAYEARHAPGTRARLALALLLYTGQRRSDIVRLGRQHARGGTLRFTQWKNRNRHPVTLEIPLLPALAAAIEAGPTGDLTYLVTAYGRPFTPAGFGNWFRARCDEAGLVQCSAHGLRKAGAVRAAELGATAHQLMAIFGWRSLAEAERYTKAVSQRRLAAAAMGLLARRERG